LSPLTLIFLIPLVLAALAWSKRIYPRTAMVWWALVPAVLSVSLASVPEALPGVLAVDVVLAAVLLADLATLPRSKWFECQREIGRIASLKKHHPVRLTISNRSSRPLEVQVRDEVPDECDAVPEQFRLRLPAMSRSTVR
jgi:hypothetical protein